MLESIECEHCGRTIRKGPGEASHMRAMHPDVPAAQAKVEPPPSTSVDTDLVWEEPPPKWGRGRLAAQLAGRVVQLKRRPGDWARIEDWPKKSSASTAAKGLREAFPDCEFEPRATDGGSAIWARYVEGA